LNTHGDTVHDTLLRLDSRGVVKYLEHYARGTRLVWSIEDWNALSLEEQSGPVAFGEVQRSLHRDTAFFRSPAQNLDTPEKP
jgi:hypothetical protein